VHKKNLGLYKNSNHDLVAESLRATAFWKRFENTANGHFTTRAVLFVE